ncbi:hypothetical protein BO94DRAFT_560112 [Aspergillus sclerotioniger CBS 115572]|uniref:Uncharacterized protein n=1 Tax=Aspergillus sclerotioniger CBS 115572 TaxID=1450535 RepID=A0A317VKV8_9EURO|nr:hypothetical protein BO94DRAFT_560112 [Aspergillus sclerotioniger CBS 115572]PWY72560.1 hypothetical protein BO94DRAFT_560112 [Aspergillus sclerotioniger CBS 115572]
MAHAGEEVNHGKKRPAESVPESDHQPLAKKFGRLHISPSVSTGHVTNTEEKLPASASSDLMLLDDTKHTIYIHDLDRELEDAEPRADSFTILTRYADQITAIPRLLVNNNKTPCNELVLYTEPASLSIPKEEDSVRKALIATRERARGVQQDCDVLFGNPSSNAIVTGTTTGSVSIQGPIDGYSEAMEVDIDC